MIFACLVLFIYFLVVCVWFVGLSFVYVPFGLMGCGLRRASFKFESVCFFWGVLFFGRSGVGYRLSVWVFLLVWVFWLGVYVFLGVLVLVIVCLFGCVCCFRVFGGRPFSFPPPIHHIGIRGRPKVILTKLGT